MTSILPQFSALLNQTVDRKRKASGTYVGGRFVEGSEVLTAGISASVQPPNRKHFQMLSQPIEGKRVKAWIAVYCVLDTFRGADDRSDIPPDIVVYEGDDYEVQLTTPRREPQLNFDVVLAVRLEA